MGSCVEKTEFLWEIAYVPMIYNYKKPCREWTNKTNKSVDDIKNKEVSSNE